MFCWKCSSFFILYLKPSLASWRDSCKWPTYSSIVFIWFYNCSIGQKIQSNGLLAVMIIMHASSHLQQNYDFNVYVFMQCWYFAIMIARKIFAQNSLKSVQNFLRSCLFEIFLPESFRFQCKSLISEESNAFKLVRKILNNRFCFRK